MKNSVTETEIRADSILVWFSVSCSTNIVFSLLESLCFIHWHLSASVKTYKMFPQADSCNKSGEQSSVDAGLAPALGISFCRLCWHHDFWLWAQLQGETCASHHLLPEGCHQGNPARSQQLAKWKNGKWLDGKIPDRAGLAVGSCPHYVLCT